MIMLLGLGCSGSGSKKHAEDTVPPPPDSWDFDTGSGRDTIDNDTSGGDATVTVQEINEAGFLAFCSHDDNCAIYGLKCFTTGAGDPDPVCSMECQQTSDCPAGLLCKYKAGARICYRAAYCDLCTTSVGCGEGMKCLDDDNGNKYCANACDISDPSTCEKGSFCISDKEGIWCRPVFGACREDGKQCSRCRLDKDCGEGMLCHLNERTGETYCAKICQTEQECPPKFGCHQLLGESVELCTLEFDGQPAETCEQGTKSFCQPCLFDQECGTGVCFQHPVEKRYACSFACDTARWPGEGCPPGLYCSKNYGTSTAAKVCMPPGSWGCQGFLNCKGVNCQAGEVCKEGFCGPK